MSRDTSDLHSGINSRSTLAVRAKREADSTSKAKERIALEPYQEVVKGILDKKLAEAIDFRTLRQEFDASEETMKAIVAARTMNIAFIEETKLEIMNKLREAQPKTKRRRRSEE